MYEPEIAYERIRGQAGCWVNADHNRLKLAAPVVPLGLITCDQIAGGRGVAEAGNRGTGRSDVASRMSLSAAS